MASWAIWILSALKFITDKPVFIPEVLLAARVLNAAMGIAGTGSGKGANRQSQKAPWFLLARQKAICMTSARTW